MTESINLKKSYIIIWFQTLNYKYNRILYGSLILNVFLNTLFIKTQTEPFTPKYFGTQL